MALPYSTRHHCQAPLLDGKGYNERHMQNKAETVTITLNLSDCSQPAAPHQHVGLFHQVTLTLKEGLIPHALMECNICCKATHKSLDNLRVKLATT